MITGGYVDGDSGPFDLFPCTPRGGIWINTSVPANTTEMALLGENPDGGGVFSMSVGFVDEAGFDVRAQTPSQNDGFDFNSTRTGVLDGLTGAPTRFDNAFLNDLLVLSGIVNGWQIFSFGLGSNIRGYYLSLWGDLMETKVGTFDVSLGGGTYDITGIGFDPDLILFVGAEMDSVGGLMQIGALDAAGNQWASAAAISYIDAGPTLDKQQYSSKSGSCLYCPAITSFAGTAGHEASAQIITDGFRVTTITTPPVVAPHYVYLAIKDPNGRFAVGFGDMSADVSGLGFEPEAVFFATTWNTNSTPTGVNGISTGFVSEASPLTDPSVDVASVFTENDQQKLSFWGTRWRSGTESHSLVQTNSAGTVTKSMDAAIGLDGFSVTASDTSRQYGWVAMKGSQQADCPVFGFIPQIYRLVRP